MNDEIIETFLLNLSDLRSELQRKLESYEESIIELTDSIEQGIGHRIEQKLLFIQEKKEDLNNVIEELTEVEILIEGLNEK